MISKKVLVYDTKAEANLGYMKASLTPYLILINQCSNFQIIMSLRRTIAVGTHFASSRIKYSGVVGSGLRGGLKTWAAAWLQQLYPVPWECVPTLAAKVSPKITHSSPLLNFSSRLAATTFPADLLITCTTYNGLPTYKNHSLKNNRINKYSFAILAKARKACEWLRVIWSIQSHFHDHLRMLPVLPWN